MKLCPTLAGHVRCKILFRKTSLKIYLAGGNLIRLDILSEIDTSLLTPPPPPDMPTKFTKNGYSGKVGV